MVIAQLKFNYVCVLFFLSFGQTCPFSLTKRQWRIRRIINNQSTVNNVITRTDIFNGGIHQRSKWLWREECLVRERQSDTHECNHGTTCCHVACHYTTMHVNSCMFPTWAHQPLVPLPLFFLKIFPTLYFLLPILTFKHHINNIVSSFQNHK